MVRAVSASMYERTGKTVEEWVAIVAGSGVDPTDQKAVRSLLKSRWSLPQNSQWAIADAAARAAGWLPPSVEDYVTAQFSGAKAALRPIYDALTTAILAQGDDVRVEGRSTYIPFVRKRQFAAISAATRTRVDLGLRFTDAPANSRLIPSANFAQASHRVALSALGEVDAELRELIAIAYDQNG